MKEFISDFGVGFALFGLGVGFVAGSVFGSIAFWFWMSGGQPWGLPCAITTMAALLGGFGYAASQAQEL